MKKLLVVLAVISLTGSVAFAQKVHSDNQDIRFAAGVRVPIERSSASDETVMTLTYGRKWSKSAFRPAKYGFCRTIGSITIVYPVKGRFTG